MSAADEWGETAEERRARIAARDLAWLVASESAVRDGVQRTPRDRVIFDEGYGAGRADYLRPPITEEQVEAGAFVIDEGAMDSPEDYPLQAEAALSLSRAVLEAAREAGR